MQEARATTGEIIRLAGQECPRTSSSWITRAGRAGGRESRHLISEESDHSSGNEALEEVMSHTSTSVYFHKLVLSPGEDEYVEGWHAWTREIMSDLVHLLLSCFLLQMFAAWIRLANRSSQGALPRPIACYLDECGSAGSVLRMTDLIATLRSRHIALMLACQSFAYDGGTLWQVGAETILSNASTHIVLPGVGQREAEFYARRIGKTTITSQPRRRWAGWVVSSHRGEVARWLIELNEIRTLPARQTLMLADMAAPFLIRVKPYYCIIPPGTSGQSAISVTVCITSSTANAEGVATTTPSTGQRWLVTQLTRSTHRKSFRSSRLW